MKIGIITFWDSQDNYGQILQCYALSTYLRNAAHQPVIIRYKPDSTSSKLAFIKKCNPSHIISYWRYRKAQRNQQKQYADVKRDFDGFRTNHMTYTERVYVGFSQLWHEDWSSFDAFICGSDQIWSPKPDEQLNAYFLQFAPFKCLRVAYAPSFGRSVLPKQYQKELHALLRHFDAVSVREREGVGFCQQAGIDCKLVCDPTLLLRDDDYRKLTRSDKRDGKVFCYLINWDTMFPKEEVNNLVKRYAGVHHFCTNGQNPVFPYEKEQTIGNWLMSIQQSSLSLTNSFHGTVFSILSHTPFISFPLTGEASAMNNRLTSLLTMLGLDNRIYRDGIDLHQLAEAPIDWDDVDSRLEEFRMESAQFLSDALRRKVRKCCHNICFLTRSSVHHNYGGLDRVTELLADYFVQQGGHVYYVSQVRRETLHEDRQYFLPGVSQFQSSANAEWLNAFLKEHDVDVLINQEGNVDLTLPVKDGVKRITVLHFNPNYISDNHFDNKFRNTPLLKAVFHSFIGRAGVACLRRKLSRNYKHQIEWADNFVMLSDLFRGTLTELLPAGYDCRKVLAINNPLCIDKLPAFRSLEKQKTILYVGRIDNSFKNVDKLIRIWGAIAKDVPEWTFEICGDGADVEINRRIIEQEHISRCRLMGLVNPTDFYKRASVIVMASSSSEGWGMVLVEAMQYGCVPIALNSYAAVHDIIEHNVNGVVVEPTKNWESQFTRQLLNLVQDECNRSQMSKNAIESVRRFDMNNIGQQWLKLIDD